MSLYDALLAVSSSPVVALNRALAISETLGPDAVLREIDAPFSERSFAQYQPYWAARAELLRRTWTYDEAWRSYEIAIGLERDDAVRRFLQRRQSQLPKEPAPNERNG